MIFPIYDMTDKDVWRYIYENNLDIPNAYIYLYQTGTSKSRLRLSQFFSIDTAKSLVNMCEYYPDLFNKICKREPNAYIAMLYWDTELFRRQKKALQTQEDDKIDYKAKALELVYDDKFFTTKSAKANQRRFANFMMCHGKIIPMKQYKEIYNALVGGDPKARAFRAVFVRVFKDLADTSKGEVEKWKMY